MRIDIPSELRRTVREAGAEAWLADLPRLVDRVAASWQLDVGPPLPDAGSASLTLPARGARTPSAVLKLSMPHAEARGEAAALRRWDAAGAVRLLRSSDDGLVLLLERCLPGHSLWTLPLAGQLDVVAELLPRLWQMPEAGSSSPGRADAHADAPAPSTLPDLDETAARWAGQMRAKGREMGVVDEVADRARVWALELSGSGRRRLLHGDFHPGNVLAAEREPWLAIDPKPWVGDPAFDLAQLLANWVDAGVMASGDEVVSVHRHAAGLSERLGLDPARTLRWTVVKALGWGFGRRATLLLDEVARRHGHG